MEILTWYFGILGGLLTVLFLSTVWYWMRYSRLEKGAMKRAGDLKVVGYGFLMMASWLMCGILGPPNAILRPEIARVESALGSSYAVMLFLFLGFLFILLGQRVMYKAKASRTASPQVASANIGKRRTGSLKILAECTAPSNHNSDSAILM